MTASRRGLLASPKSEERKVVWLGRMPVFASHSAASPFGELAGTFDQRPLADHLDDFLSVEIVEKTVAAHEHRVPR